MPLTKLLFKPGVNRETTSYSNEGGWFDVDKVRFRFGFPEKIGGWIKRSASSFLGTCRALHPWMTLSQDKFIGVGTNLKYYIDQGGEFIDITPLRLTAGAGDATFSASNGDATVTVTETAHGAVKSDFVTFSAAVSLGGNITAARLNQEYQIATIVDDNNFTIEAREVADLGAITVDGQYTPTPVLASAGDTGNGGTLTVAAYQVNVGLDTTVFGNGWGAGTWGRGTWGSAANVNVLTETLRIWSHDNFGQDLLINVRDGGVYYWDAAVGLGTRAVNIVDLAGSVSAPTIAKQVLVSDRDRHVIVFGCDTESDPGVQDPLAIRFSSQESLTDWATSADNTAGELRLGSGSEIVTAVETKQQILVYTDESLYAMQFLGPPFTFGINLISEKTSIMGPLAAVAVEDNVFWMGQQQFFAFAGTVQQIPCTVRDYVFDNFNYSQTEKVIASVNGQNSEVWWFYPSASSENVDKYVVYNYIEQVWYYGNLARTAWMDQGIYDDPIAASQDGYLYEHELGFDDGSTTPATAISAYIESSQVDIGDGDNFAFISRLVPDVTFLNSTASTPSATMTLKTRNFPGGNYLQTLGTPVEKTASVPVEQFTQKIDVRLRGRSFAFRMSSEDTGVSWRLGSPRLDIRPDGRR
tara:strand:+ start:10908 stop:12824 length:1917 start_codon:yes stop_codon:yes gene_type:complete